MKTITLTDKQFDSIFDFIDSKLEFVIEYEKKLEKARAKQPKAEW